MTEQNRQPTLYGFCQSPAEASEASENTEQPKRKVRKIQAEGRTFNKEWERQ